MCSPTLPGFSRVTDLSPAVILTWEIWLLCLRTHNDQVLNSIYSHKPLLPSSQHSGKCWWPGLWVLGRTHPLHVRQELYHWATPPSPRTYSFKIKYWKQECVSKHLDSQHLGGRGILKPPWTAWHVWGQLRPHETLLDETKEIIK